MHTLKEFCIYPSDCVKELFISSETYSKLYVVHVSNYVYVNINTKFYLCVYITANESENGAMY